MTPGYPNIDVLNRILMERYGDNLDNKEFLPPELRNAPKTQRELEHEREQEKFRVLAAQKPLPHSSEIEIGETVEALYGNGQWYTAQIKSRVEGSPDTFEVAWSDGDPMDTIKHKSNIRRLVQAASIAQEEEEEEEEEEQQQQQQQEIAEGNGRGAISKAERWKQRAAADSSAAKQKTEAGGAIAAEAASAPAMSKEERWKKRVAAAADRGNAGIASGASMERAPEAPGVQKDVDARPMTKAEKWAMRAAAGAGAPAAAAMAPAPGAGDSVGSSEGAEGFSGQHRDTRPVMPPGATPVPHPILSSTRPSGEVKPRGAGKTEANKLLYMQIQTPDFKYSGWTRGGEPDVSGSMWFKDLSEYHGSISNGKPHGAGKHFFPDGARLECSFIHGCPEGPGILIDGVNQYWNVMYKGDLSLQDGAQPTLMEETVPEAFRPTKAECVALTIGAPQPVAGTENPATGKPKLAGVFPNSADVKGTLVWARPPFADMPLWNAEQVRGKIVAIVRGPAAPATAVSYGTKLHHAQQAGAKAVIFVDYDPNGKFDAMPRIDEGIVQYGVRPTPPDVDVKARIPSVLVLNRHTATLQEGAHHVLAFAPPGFPGIPYGWKVGFICVPPQESKVGLSKATADALMQEFFNERKKERQEEGQLLKDNKEKGEDLAEKVLKSREFYGGNFFDSLNPLKQVKDTDGVDDMVRNSVISNMKGLVRQAGVSDARLKDMQSKFEQFSLDVQAKLPSMPALPGITWEEEEEVAGETQGEFTLASWRKKAGIKVPKWQQEKEKEKEKAKTKEAQAPQGGGGTGVEGDELKGCFIIEHNPYMPCVRGHGPRWLYHDTADDSLIEKRQLGLLHLDPKPKS